MANSKFENVYISSNCNQCPNALHWGNNNLICYASCNSVCIYDPEFGSGGKVVQSLAKHTALVNSVRWLKGSDVPFENEIVSGSADGDVIVWTLNDGKFSHNILKGHNSNIAIVDGMYRQEERMGATVVSGSMEGNVKIWYRPTCSDAFVLRQTLDFGYNICISMRIYTLDLLSNHIILAVSLDDSSIRLFLEDDTSQELNLKPAAKLKGHEDWICGLDFTRDGGDLLLASSSQDNFIRIWRMTRQEKSALNSSAVNMKTSKWNFKIYVESILIGHEGWVYSVSWNPINNTLLSASWDKTMVIWEFDKEHNLWLDNIRVGEVGGNTLGFFGGVFGPDGDTIIGYGYHGAFHMWKNDGVDWNPMVTVGGHFRQVVDLAWDPKGSYLFSVSSDQTCRIHAPWPTEKSPITWHEIGRPQVHGYDMNSIAVFSKYKYASASEEKVIRTFAAPSNFIDNYIRICKVDNDHHIVADNTTAKGASVPSLGLSNKAVFTSDNNAQSQVKNSKEIYPEESYFTALDLDEPPTEETLLQNTLWPEIRKLYGHGYEVYGLSASSDGKYLASACKSTTQEHAAVLLWDTADWKQIQKLISHTLTVTQMCFSPDSQRILTVSRDRRWSIFEKNEEEKFVLAATTNKATGIHTRVIWCCAWTHDSCFFVTGSRDGKLAIWTKNPDKAIENVLGQYQSASSHLSLPKDSVTAVATAPCLISGQFLFAVGLESGNIHFYKWTIENLWQLVLDLSESIAHHLTVKKIQFRPVLGQTGKKKDDNDILQVATCSADYSLKIFNLFIKNL
ncbi:hypothetical protein HHI36_008437 [Cryptolaemus montrouzieri]|uniref:Elongator complex protein 2 n=1 Tax=Cryptolaemus montrouzieri TaxID=559131 RepID=A0ABD2MSK4_9CUCU